ncbi:AAA+ superfamily predicted ATPase [Catenuloplanes nepalensis]|uniref:AAA+ superfamily predicted ATPase n=1 Tax=Catenuloplanes nepalensis TaxID=587533 RepID=A0ABT9MY00_9ACTN|nr:AAA family ATPase [Catenuloplanes nepalensis]MDP9796310.1 AAA+ superfamily predicted ATPase [Catenuloplanes nepalensis]
MPDESRLITSLRGAVEAAPDDVPLRLHLAEILLREGHSDAAITEIAFALQRVPGDPDARALMAHAMSLPGPPAPAAPAAPTPAATAPTPAPAATATAPTPTPAATAPTPAPAATAPAPAAPAPAAPAPAAPAPAAPAPAAPAPGAPTPAAPDAEVSAPAAAVAEVRTPAAPDAEEPASAAPAVEAPESAVPAGEVRGTPEQASGVPAKGFDWKEAEEQVGDVVPPRFARSAPDGSGEPDQVRADGKPGPGDLWQAESVGGLTLADVGGMHEVKERLEAAFLAPMRNPELRRLFGKSLRGGLLLYGPPGCGKTFIARAVAGELGARFLTVAISDVLDMWLGTSERNMHEVFATARRMAPCVIFLDELDALGGKRGRAATNSMRTTVNQLLTELDGVDGAKNEGVFVLAATNVPWDVDVALRRPGRLDRTILVLPPDAPARAAILEYHLRDRPIENVDLPKLVKATDGLSGADLAHLCESAAERALLDSARTGTVRMIGMPDLLAAAKTTVPSVEPWFAAARNVAMFANEGGMYDDLLAYLKARRRL